MQHLRIAPQGTDSAHPQPLGTGFSWTRSPTGHLEAPMPAFDALEKMLVSRFVNCRSIHFDGADFPNECDEPEGGAAYPLSRLDALGALLLIVARGLPLKSFHINRACDGGMRAKWLPLGEMQANRPPVGEMLTAEFKRNWAENVQELACTTRYGMECEWGLSSELILCATRLRTLRLDGWIVTDAEDNNIVPKFFDRLCAVDFSPGIQELSICHGQLQVKRVHNLVGLLRHLRHSLRKLSLEGLRLDWAGVLEEMRWGFRLESIRLANVMTTHTASDRLSFRTLRENSTVPGGGKIQLIPWSEKSGMIIGVSYTGCNMEEALRMIICNISYKPYGSPRNT